MSVHFLKCFPSLQCLLSCSEDDDQEVYDDIAAGQGINDYGLKLGNIFVHTHKGFH